MGADVRGHRRASAAGANLHRGATGLLACLELAAGSPTTAAAVRAAWATERGRLETQLLEVYFPDAVDEDTRDDAENLQAYLLGLSIRRALDPALTPERASALLDRLLAALGRAAPTPE
jgi:hypothetical protein